MPRCIARRQEIRTWKNRPLMLAVSAEKGTRMSIFETKLTWRQGKLAVLDARDNPAVEVATPPEFARRESGARRSSLWHPSKAA